MMELKRKVRTIIRCLEEESLELEHQYALIKSTLEPSPHSELAHGRVRAMQAINEARKQVDAAMTWLGDSVK